MVAEFFYGWSFNTVDVLRPQFRDSLGLTLVQAGSAYTAQSMGALIGAIVLAQLADRLGRRRLLFWIIAGFGVFGSLGALVTSYPQLLLQRLVLGFFLGGIFPVLVASYMSLFPSTMRGKLSALGLGTYFASGIALGWAYGTQVAQADFHVLLWAGALPAVVIAPLVFLFLPDDRHMKPWGAEVMAPAAGKFPITELFTPGLRRTTLLLFILVGLNFFSIQAFSGWITIYLKDVKNFAPGVIAGMLTWQAIGGLLGCFFWGWCSDRFGRRISGIGFFVAAALVLLYLFVLDGPIALEISGALWAFMIAASVAWAPWMSELYPPHLRSTAMSIFHWGRIISMTAPLITGAIAEAFGLPAAMFLSAAGLFIGGVVWLMIPETLERRRAPLKPEA